MADTSWLDGLPVEGLGLGSLAVVTVVSFWRGWVLTGGQHRERVADLKAQYEGRLEDRAREYEGRLEDRAREMARVESERDVWRDVALTAAATSQELVSDLREALEGSRTTAAVFGAIPGAASHG